MHSWVDAHVKKPENGPVTPGMTLPRPARIIDERVARVYPDVLFYISRYRMYPVGFPVPAPLSANNLFVVGKDGSVQLITTVDDLKKYVLATLVVPNVPAADITKGGRQADDGLKDAAYTWLRLSEELHQDGMFRFSIPADSLKVEIAQVGMQPLVTIVSGKAVVDPVGGNRGDIQVTMWFADNGARLTDVQEVSTVTPGMRPICQATKLLDADPIVRRMAEQDLLMMGPAAESYIMEQRAKATPELQAAIDRMWAEVVKNWADR